MKRVFNLLTAIVILLACASFGMGARAYAVVNIQHDLTRAEIMSMAQKLPHSGLKSTASATRYSMYPSLRAPYRAGALNSEDIADALNALKMVRFLAGVPYKEVRFTPELNTLAQHGAVLLASSGQLSHMPTQPDDMLDNFFHLGYYGCLEANIFGGTDNISVAVIGFVADGGANNIQAAGHRRWILSPGAGDYGIGYAKGEGTYGGGRINMHVFRADSSMEAASYIAWPNSGDFPIQYFVGSEDIDAAPAHAWSVNLGASYAAPSRESIKIQMVRLRDGEKWLFDHTTPSIADKDSPSMHLSVDDDYYGMGKAILFRPDLSTLGVIKDRDIFEITLSGIYTIKGAPAEISYRIHFFDMEKPIG